MDGSVQAARESTLADLEPIAIIGAACRLPGAPDLQAFERLLVEGRDAIGEVPDTRWAKERYFHPERGQVGKSYTFAAGLLGTVDLFDPAFFGISPREAAQMDPQQRLMLELAHESIEDAGLDGAALAGSAVGVYVGGSSWDYMTLHTGDPSITDAYSMTGATLCSLANRVSYAFDLHGPSFTVDTACSSSLVALHQACEAIRLGQVPMALVGGVNLLLAPHSFVGFSAASMLSPRGRCHAFDARADGYVRAEGGAMVVLRPLRDALAAGDTIRAVIRGTGVNSDGRTTGFSLPNKAAQADLLQAVYARFGIDPERLSYMEAHGTGTPAGDPIEAGALGTMLGLRRSSPLPIGSVKTNIGHLEAASGLAGLLKAVLAMERGVVPASLHCETPNPAIPFAELNLRLVPEPFALPAGPRLAGVNSFGFGGTNAHAVVEVASDYGDSAPAAQVELGSVRGSVIDTPLLLSARSEAALRDLAGEWRAMLDRGLVDGELVRGAAVAREQHKHRMVVQSGTVEHSQGAIGDWLDGRASHDVTVGEAASGRVAFVFSGNGSQWAGMGRDAAERNTAFRETLGELDGVLLPMLGWSVMEKLGEVDTAALRDTTIAQPLLFAVQVATVEALRVQGIRGDLFMGHSVGEVAAAWAAGALDLEQACRVIAARSRLQKQTHGGGRMAVLALPWARALEVVEGSGLEIAAYNSSSAVTVAGPAAAITAMAARAKRERWAFAEMDLEHAFHSAAMEPIQAPLLSELKSLGAPACPASFVSTVSGAAMPHGSRLGSRYWWRNVRDPVQFAQGAAALVACGARVFVEIGPQPVLQAYLNDALRQVDATGRVVSSLTRRSAQGRDPIALAAARCHVAGCDMRGAEAFTRARRHRGLPSYPWQRQRHWLGRTSESTDTAEVAFEHPLLGARRDGTEAVEWRNHMGPSLQRWLGDHVVGGTALAPAAMLVEMALACARACHPNAASFEVLDFEISRALAFEADIMREVRTRVSAVGRVGDVEISSRPRFSADPWTVHATGRVMAGETTTPARALPAPIEGPSLRTDATSLYRDAARLGLDYGPAFQTVVTVDAAPEGIAADVALAEMAGLDAGLLLPPTLLDGAFQGLVALAARLLPAGDGVLPWRFGRVRLLQPAGTVPVSARLRVGRVGPRAVRADIMLLDGAGEPVAEALDCWFVRVAFGGLANVSAGWLFSTEQAASPDPRLQGTAGALLATVLGESAEPAVAGEAGLLADAFVTAAAEEAWRGLLPDPTAPFTLDVLVQDGLVAPAARDAAQEHLAWLAADGLAVADGDTWRMTGEEGMTADDILRTLVFDTSGAVSDAALLSSAAEGFAATLRDGPGADGPPSPALIEPFLHVSAPGAQAIESLVQAIATVARAWPAGQPLRVLQLGARRGTFSRVLLRRLAQAGKGVLRFDAVTEAADQPALAEAIGAFPGAAAIAWPAGEPPENGAQYDVIVGYCALALGAVAVDDLPSLLPMAPGGLVLLAEPGPNRTWSLVWPEAARRIADGDGWRTTLAAAGAVDAEWRGIDGSWPANLIAARVPMRSRPAHEDLARIVILAEADNALAPTLVAALEAEGAVSAICPPSEATAAFASWARRPGAAPSRIVVLPAGDAPAWLDRVARCAEAVPEGAITVLMQGGADPLEAALTGMRRVMANEMPDVACRIVRLGDDLATVDATARAMDEILYPDAESEVCWTKAGRSVPRVRRGLPARRDAAPRATTLRLSVARPGLLDSLGWDGVDAPAAPGPGQVSIRVRAAGLNFRDVMWALGLLPDEALLDGFAGPTLGLECAGEICAVGEGAEGFAVGDRVMAFAPASMGTHATTAAHAVMRMPEGMSFAAAATVPVAFLTVAYALGHLARLGAGERVLIHGGAGGVGLAAIQYARLRGARVFATAGSAPKRALLRRLGVDAVLDSRSLNFADEVMQLTSGEGVDVVLNSLSGEAMERSLGLLRPFGRFLELGKRDFYGNTAVGLRPFRHNVSYFGVDADQLPLRRPALAAELFAEVAGLMRDGSLRPLPHRGFDAADASEAFRLMQGSGHIGKIVLEVGEGEAAPEARSAATTPSAVTRADRTYVVTGGLGGFGLETARWLAGQGARQLALLGRRGAETPGSEEAIAALAETGVSAVAFACDVADEASLGEALDEIRRTMPPIAGVVHAAVAMDDALLPELDEARFARALRPKLGGAEALDALTRSDPIELFLVFSSVTTVLGNPGQANYVAANAAAEAVVVRRHAQGLPGLAVQWGPIGDAGYLVREQGVAKLLSRRLGGRLLNAREALAVLPGLLASGEAVVGLADVRWGSLGTSLPLLRSSLFESLRGGAAEPAAEVDLRELLASSPPDVARTKLIELLSEEVARIMKTAPSSIQAHRPLAELGMDSLMAVELRLAIEQRFGLSVPVLALSEGATLAALAGRMVRSIGAAGAPAAVEEVAVARMTERLSLFEPGEDGPADGAPDPAEQSFAASAAATP